MSMLPRILWLLLALLPAMRALALGDVLFERVDDADQIPDNNVTVLAQDDEGFIWIGTPNGLIRYDGYRFTRFLSDPADPQSLGGVFIRALLVAADGRLWIGTDADGVSVLDPDTGRFRNHRHVAGDAASLAHDQVRALAQDRDGTIWVGTRAGLQRWNGAGFEQPLALGSGDQRVYALAASAGQLWIGAWSGVHVRRADGRVEPVPGPLAGQLIMSLLALEDGRIAVGTAEVGSHLIDAATLDSRPIPQPVEPVASTSDALALAMVQPRDSELWLAAFGGITVVDPADGRVLRRIRPDPAVRTGLAHAQIRCFLRDRAGLVWIGGYSGGLQRHDPRNDAIRVLHHSPYDIHGISSPSISSILEVQDGRVWLGTREHGIDVFDLEHGLVDRHRPRPGEPGALGNGMVISLAQLGDGSVFAGTLAGLYHWLPDRKRFESIGREQGLSGSTVRTLLADPGGDLWIGSNTGLARWHAHARRVEELATSGGGLLSADVNALARDGEGRLWIGSAGGLYRLEPGASVMQPVRAANGGASPTGESVVGLLLDHRGGLWVDTSEGLLHSAQPAATDARYDPVSLRHGIAGQPFGANLLEDAQGRIWTQKFVHDPDADSVYELTRADGLDIGTAWYRSYARTRSGLLLFGGSDGVALVDPQRFAPWHDQPPVVVTELRVDGRMLARSRWRDGLVLDAGSRGFSVEFAALDYSAPQRNRYAYRLEGYEPDWIEADAGRRIATYANLWPGGYRLLVRGSNRSGEFAATPLVMPLRVLPRYWQTPWFALLTVILLGASAWGLWWRHLRRVRRHEHELEQMVGERTQQLSQAKEKAEQALVQLRGTQQQLVVAEKMAALGQLVAGVAHEINTPLGVALTAASVQGEELRALQQRIVARTLRPSDLQQYLDSAQPASRLVEEHLQRAARLVQSFRQVSGDRRGDERRRFELCPWLHEVVDGFAALREGGAVRVQVDCEPGLVFDSYPGTLAQVLATFAQNALLHAFEPGRGGMLSLRARGAGEDALEIEFADDGKGIAAAERARMFEPFHTTRRAEGFVGLGLHIVFDRVNARLGGRVSVASEPGKGTRFTLRLPRVAP